MADLKAIRDFFSEEEWQIIDYAISEYQDHLFEDDGEQEIYDSIQDKLNQLFHEVQSWSFKSLSISWRTLIVLYHHNMGKEMKNLHNEMIYNAFGMLTM